MHVLIFSQANDFTTNEVAEWLGSKGIEFERIGHESLEKSPMKSLIFDTKGANFSNNSQPVHSAWFRKAFFILPKGGDTLESNCNEFFLEEMREYRRVLYYSLPYCGIKVLGTNHIDFYDVSKIRVLWMAQSVGLKIPRTIITTSKMEIQEFKGKHQKIISKPLSNPKFLASADKLHTFAMYTSFVDDDTLEKLDEVVMPCFIQEYIEKSVELRVFFCEEAFYCAAIFSQNNQTTLSDFRNYSTSTVDMNKFVPFRLSSEIQSKLSQLMALIGLNTGSIDMILSPDGDYIFLEVNPVGQFGMISHPCNFFLEEKVAHFLTT